MTSDSDSVSGHRPPSAARAWWMWAAAASVYLVAVFHRASLSVAGIAAAERFDIGAAQLASFTVLQLVVYAGMQIPVGLLLDRHGSKRLLATGLALMTASQIGFAFVAWYPAALMMRALVGIGDAMTFLSVMRLVALWFPPARNALLAQLTSLAGQLGAVLAAVPMAHALLRFGWTMTFVAAATLGLVAGVALFALIRDTPPRTARASAGGSALLQAVRAAWANPGTRLGAWAYFLTLFCPNVMVLLWGFPYFVDGQGASATVAATLVTVLTAAAMVSGPLIGVLVGRHPTLRLPLLATVVAAMAAAWTAALAWPGAAPTWLLTALVIVVGIGFATAMIAFDFAREAVAPARVGTALALVNLAGYASTIGVVFGVGLVLDLLTPTDSAHYARAAMRLAMLVPYLAWGVGAVGLVRARCALRRAGRPKAALDGVGEAVECAAR